MMHDPSDLLSFDRDVARAFAAWSSWKQDIGRDPTLRADEEPLERWRHVAGKSLYETLRDLSPSAADVPHRDALRRWVYALTQARITQGLDAEMARAEHDKSAHATVPVAHLASAHEAWRGILEGATAHERRAWLDVAAERGPALASIARRRTERRVEAAHRIGLANEDALFAVPRDGLVSAAIALLDRTDDIAREALHDARKRGAFDDDPPLAVDAIAIAVARDAPEGWPARLTWQWLDATFGAFTKGLRLEAPRLLAPIGASTFARVCASFGASIRVAGASPSLPFALARDPQFTAMHRFAAVFGALPASPAFQRRVLGNGARVASAQARVLARTALLHARLEAARFLTSRAPGVIPFDDLTHRLFAAPLPSALAGAWPRADDDAPARLVGLLTAPALARDLVGRFDEDWFANPRAVRHLRAIASGPAHEDASPEPGADLAKTIAPLARAFEEACG
jgi:hypothetical protein